ncbi:MAG: EamA family transporter [Ruminococcaceae bacterium]|nr:EamA family transporter [Oscillospiraceae bacterium]
MKKAAFLIVIAGVLWGGMGIFVRTLSPWGLSSLQITFIRCIVTSVLLILYLLITDRNALRIKLRDIWIFLGSGILSILFFSVCYSSAIVLSSMPVAAVLLYTAPAMVTVMAAIFFREKLTAQKIAALVAAFAGCVLVSGIGTDTRLTAAGFLTGLGAGFGYALYSIFGKVALKKYSVMTVTTYTFTVAAVAAMPFANIPQILQASVENELGWLVVLLTGVVTGVIPYVLYTQGLKNTEASIASIVASVEPLTATVLGVTLYQDRLSFGNVMGIVCIIGAIIILAIKIPKKAK